MQQRAPEVAHVYLCEGTESWYGLEQRKVWEKMGSKKGRIERA